MDKVLELVVIASVIAIACSGTFEIAKDWFLKLGRIWKAIILLGLFSLAGALAFSIENKPTFEQRTFVIPVPVPSLKQFKINEITVTTKAPLIPSIIFGLFIAFLAITEAFGDKAFATKTEDYPSIYYKNPLIFYPMLALAYKIYVLPGGTEGESMFSLIMLFILSILILPLTKRLSHGTLNRTILAIFAIIYTATISLAILL